MGLGAVALQHLLGGDLDLGDELVDVSAESAVHAHVGDGRRRPPPDVVRLWTAVGDRRADQYFYDCVASLLRMLARLPVASTRPTLPGAGGVERAGFLGDTDAVVGAQLLRVWQTDLRPWRPRGGAPHRQQSAGRGLVGSSVPRR